METFYTVLATIVAWHLLNFIVLSLVEKYGPYVETTETVMVWLNSAIILAPFWLIYRIPQIIYKKYFKYRLYYLGSNKCALLVKGLYRKPFDKKKYLDDREVSKSLKKWKAHEYIGEESFTYTKMGKYYLLIKK